MATDNVRRILIVGATGKQGGGVIKALVANPPSFEYEILAVTRKANSASAQKLAANPKIKIVEGDLNDCPKLFEAAGGKGSIWGAFLVTLPSMKKLQPNVVDKETAQGCAFIDAALDNGVQHLVFSSVERGGNEKSWTNPTPVPHFITKHEIELYLRDKIGEQTEATYTILRPVAFMDNYMPGFIGRMFAASWAQLGEKKLQVVAVDDIGVFGAKALSNASSEDYKNKAIGLAGSEITQAEANEAMWSAKGRPMTQAYWIIANLIKWMVADLGIMFNWFKTDGYGADLEQCKRLHPELMDFKQWLEKSSKIV